MAKPYESTKAFDDIYFPCSAGEEPLTAGEAALVRSIFGDEVKTDSVKKYYSPKEKRTPTYFVDAQTFGADSIKFYGDKNKSADYSRSNDTDKCGTFIHEMTHIWQNQLRGLRKFFFNAACPSTTSYVYTLKKRSRFTHFGKEQQASIIQDYVRQFLFFNRKPGAGASDMYLSSASSPEGSPLCNLALLQRVVEKRFPQARKTREALEAQRAAAVTSSSPSQALKMG